MDDGEREFRGDVKVLVNARVKVFDDLNMADAARILRELADEIDDDG